MARANATGAPAISGQVVKVSGETLQLASGTGPISVSGQPIKISGETVIAKVSGETVTTSIASGSIVTVSGNVVIAKVSGETVIAKVSGETVTTSIASGSIVTVSGNVVIAKVSGETLIAKVSGEVVDIKVPTTVKTDSLKVITGASGGQVLHSGAVVSVTIKAVSANSGDLYVGGATNRPYSGFGFQLEKGEAVNLDASDFADVYLCATVSGDRVTFLGIA
jgi:hypothetical protein